MSFEPERPAKRRKVDENSAEPEVRPFPYMACARILQAFWYREGIFVVQLPVSYRFFIADEYE